MPRITVIALAGLALSATATKAENNHWMTGWKLYEVCKSESFACPGYIQGVMDLASMYDGLFEKQGVNHVSGVCDPPGPDIEKITGLVVKYLRDHPEERRYSAASTIQTVLQQAYPCNHP